MCVILDLLKIAPIEDDVGRVVAVGDEIGGRFRHRGFDLGHHLHRVLVDHAPVRVEHLVHEGARFLRPFAPLLGQMLLGVDVVQEDEARRPAVEDRELIEDVQDAGVGVAWKTLDRHHHDVRVADHRRDRRDKLIAQQGVDVHRDRGQGDRVVVTGDADVEVLQKRSNTTVRPWSSVTSSAPSRWTRKTLSSARSISSQVRRKVRSTASA